MFYKDIKILTRHLLKFFQLFKKFVMPVQISFKCVIQKTSHIEIKFLTLKNITIFKLFSMKYHKICENNFEVNSKQKNTFSKFYQIFSEILSILSKKV
jgi:hypothetical protein